jgi:Dynamin family/Bacterial dynamin-like protein, helical domain
VDRSHASSDATSSPSPDNEDTQEQHSSPLALLPLLKRYRAVLRSLHMAKGEEAVRKLAQQAGANNCNVLVIGALSRGKTTLINALLGREVLAASVIPYSVINEVKWGETPRAFLHAMQPPNSTVQEIPIEQLRAVVVEGENDGQSYKKVELFWPSELCRNGVQLIEYPTLAEPDERSEVMMDYLSNADMVLFVFSCEALAAKLEMDLIDNVLIPMGHSEMFFICNGFDRIRLGEREMIEQHAIGLLAPRSDGKTERVFFVSALDALEGRLTSDAARFEHSGLARVEAALKTLLAADRERMKMRRIAAQFKASLRAAQRAIDGSKHGQTKELEALEAPYAALQEPLWRLQEKYHQIIERMSRFRDLTHELIQDMTTNFLAEMADKVEHWVEAYDIPEPVKITLAFSEAQAKKVVAEIAAYVSKQAEKEFTHWQASTLAPAIIQHTRQLQQEIETELDDFVRQVDDLRIKASGVKDNTAPFDMNTADVATFKTNLSLLGEHPREAIRAITGTPLPYSEIGKIFGVTAIGAVTVRLIGLNPFVMIPVMVGGGLVASYLRIDAATKKMKQRVAHVFANATRSQGQDRPRQIADVIAERLQKIQDTVDHRLGQEIVSVQRQVEYIRAEEEKTRAEADQQKNQLALAQQELKAIEDDLSAIASVS